MNKYSGDSLIEQMKKGKQAMEGHWKLQSLVFSSTKYKSDRVIEMDKELYSLLCAEKERQEKAVVYFADRCAHYYEINKREIISVKTNKEIHFVCVRENGTYITPRTMQHTLSIMS